MPTSGRPTSPNSARMKQISKIHICGGVGVAPYTAIALLRLAEPPAPAKRSACIIDETARPRSFRSASNRVLVGWRVAGRMFASVSAPRGFPKRKGRQFASRVATVRRRRGTREPASFRCPGDAGSSERGFRIPFRRLCRQNRAARGAARRFPRRTLRATGPFATVQ